MKFHCKTLNFVSCIYFVYRGNPANEDRYRNMIIFGYTCPTIITLCTLIVEYGSPECAKYRPRLGEENCFFAGNTFQSNIKIYRFVRYLLV